MALEAAFVTGGIRSDADGVQAMLVAVWGLDVTKWEEQMSQDIMGAHVDVLRAVAIKNRSNEQSLNTCHAGW